MSLGYILFVTDAEDGSVSKWNFCMLSRSLNQVHPWGNWKTIKGYVVLSLVCWELMILLYPQPHTGISHSLVVDDVVQTLFGSVPITVFYLSETKWQVYLSRSTAPSQAPNNDQENFSCPPFSCAGVLLRWSPNKFFSVVTDDYYW
jgi:hypothetical protein